MYDIYRYYTVSCGILANHELGCENLLMNFEARNYILVPIFKDTVSGYCTIFFGFIFLCILPDSASKHALQAYFDCLRAEVSDQGVRVSVVSPGYIQSNLSLNALTSQGNKYGGK